MMKKRFFAYCLMWMVSLVTALVFTSCHPDDFNPAIDGTLKITPSVGTVGTTFRVTYKGKDRKKIGAFTWRLYSDYDGKLKDYGSGEEFTPQKAEGGVLEGGTLYVKAEVYTSGYKGLIAKATFVGGQVVLPRYTVTIGELTNANGSIIRGGGSALERTPITLEVEEAIGYRLKPGTLIATYSYNDGGSSTEILNESKRFILTGNVTITAEFESDGTIESGEAFVGTWRCNNPFTGLSMTLIFNRDQTCSLFKSDINTTLNGTYSIEYPTSYPISYPSTSTSSSFSTNNRLLIVFTDDSLDNGSLTIYYVSLYGRNLILGVTSALNLLIPVKFEKD